MSHAWVLSTGADSPAVPWPLRRATLGTALALRRFADSTALARSAKARASTLSALPSSMTLWRNRCPSQPSAGGPADGQRFGFGGTVVRTVVQSAPATVRS